MSNRIVVIDYGANNIFSIVKALEYCGAIVEVASSGKELRDPSKILIPGVGAFGVAMQKLSERNLIDGINMHKNKGRPILGICLGMQLMLDCSEEFGNNVGLSIISGKVKKISEKSEGGCLKVPHIGWGSLSIIDKNTPILRGISPDDAFYFVHSYKAHLDASKISAINSYGNCTIPSVIASENNYGCQFHPEKSGKSGLKVLKNFILL